MPGAAASLEDLLEIYTRHPTPCTMHHTPYTLHPSPFTLRPTHYTLHSTPYTPHPIPFTLHPAPYTLNQVTQAGHPSTRVLTACFFARNCFLGNLLIQIHFITEVNQRTGPVAWVFDFPFPGSLASTWKR